jgi:hypothetical protein
VWEPSTCRNALPYMSTSTTCSAHFVLRHQKRLRHSFWPTRWLGWLGGQPSEGADWTAPSGRILIRRCYLSPNGSLLLQNGERVFFGSLRANLVRAGFQVTDCPPLTRGGKTSADIVMVMDMLDAIHHSTHFDTFVIVSSDADLPPSCSGSARMTGEPWSYRSAVLPTLTGQQRMRWSEPRRSSGMGWASRGSHPSRKRSLHQQKPGNLLWLHRRRPTGKGRGRWKLP